MASSPMSADVPDKEALDQAGNLVEWLIKNENWRPYRGSDKIVQCSHPDRMQRIKPLIDAMNAAVYSNSLMHICRY